MPKCVNANICKQAYSPIALFKLKWANKLHDFSLGDLFHFGFQLNAFDIVWYVYKFQLDH